MIDLVLTPVLGCVLQVPVAQDPTDRLLRALPPESMAVVATAGWDEIRRRAAENSWVAFFQDEGWHELYALMAALLEQGLETSELDLDPLAVLHSIHGPVAFAFDRDERGFHATLLLDVGADRAAFEDLYELVWNELEEAQAGALVRYEGVSALFVEVVDGEGDDPNLALFELDGIFGLIAHDAPEGALERLHQVVDSLQGRAEGAGFCGSAAFHASRKGWNRTPAFRATVDLSRVLHLASEEMGAKERELVDQLGAFDMRWAYANVDLGQGEALELSAGLHVPRDTVLGDFADLLGALPVDLIQKLPPSSSSISLGSYDVWGAWNLLLEVLSNYAPEAFDSLRAGLEGLRAVSDLDVEEELLAQLTGRFAGFSLPVPVEELSASLAAIGIDAGGEGTAESNGFLVELDDPYTVEDALEKLLLLSGMSAQIREDDHEGEVYQVLDLGLQTLLWAFTDEAFVYAATPTPMQALLERVEAPSTDDLHLARFRQVVEECGPEVSILTLSDTRTVVEGFVWGLDLFRSLATGGMTHGAQVRAFAEADLPDKDLAASYFRGTMIQQMARTRDALLFRFQAR